MNVQQRGNGVPAAGRLGHRVAQVFSVVAVLLGLALAGCAHDPRIGIKQFAARLDEEAARHGPAASRPALPPQKPRFVPYRVGPGDVLSVGMIGLNTATDQMGVTVRVNRMGEINLPLAGVVKVGELETEDVERTIIEKFVPSIVRTLTVHVEVTTYNTTDVMVLGEVGTPGLVQLRRTERDLIHAVAAAGGFSLAASGTVTLQRGAQSGATATFDVRDPYDLARAVIVEPLQAGDILTMEAADPFTVFVGGLVLGSGAKSFPPGTQINLLQVLASAGGPKEDVYPKEATLIRRMTDGKDVQVKLDLDRLRDGRDPNISIVAGDIVWVPETFGTRFWDFANRNLSIHASVGTSFDPIQNERYRQTRSDSSLARRAGKRTTLLHPFGGGAGGSGSSSPFSIGDPLGFFQNGSTSSSAAAAGAATSTITSP